MSKIGITLTRSGCVMCYSHLTKRMCNKWSLKRYIIERESKRRVSICWLKWDLSLWKHFANAKLSVVITLLKLIDCRTKGSSCSSTQSWFKEEAIFWRTGRSERRRISIATESSRLPAQCEEDEIRLQWAWERNWKAQTQWNNPKSIALGRSHWRNRQRPHHEEAMRPHLKTLIHYDKPWFDVN